MFVDSLGFVVRRVLLNVLHLMSPYADWGWRGNVTKEKKDIGRVTVRTIAHYTALLATLLVLHVLDQLRD